MAGAIEPVTLNPFDIASEATPRASLIQRSVRLAGIVLTILGLAFTVYIIVGADAPEHASWGWGSYPVLFLGCLGYAALSVLLVVTWGAVLDTFAPGAVNARDAFVLYAISQIMKYAPSNVLHFVGRHVILRSCGVSHRALICTVFGESGALIVGAILTVLFLESSVVTEVYERYVGANGFVVGLLLATALGALAAVLWIRGGLYRGLSAASLGRRILVRGVVALGAAGAFFVSTTLLTATICRLLLDDPVGFRASGVAAALAAAWVVGFVIPGASAGMGVRESAVILLLMPALGPGNAAAIATFYRLITAGGDVLLAGFGVVVRRLSSARTLCGSRTDA